MRIVPLIVVWILGFSLVCAGSGWAQPVEPIQVSYKSNSRLLSIEADGVPLRTVLDKISTVTGLRFYVAPGINPPVSRSLNELPVERAIRLLLGPDSNSVMIYDTETDANGKERSKLAEVRILEVGSSISQGRAAGASQSSVSGSPGTPATGSVGSPLMQLTPEEIAARRAEKEGKRAEKAAAKADRSQAKNSRGNRGGAAPPTDPAQPPPTGDVKQPTAGAPAASGTPGARRQR